MTDSISGIRELIHSTNRAWIENRVDDLKAAFAPDVVMIFRGEARDAVGRDAMLESFRDYLSRAETTVFEDEILSVHLFEETAVARFRFHVEYELRGRQHEEAGYETWVLKGGPGQWRVVWRMQGPLTD